MQYLFAGLSAVDPVIMAAVDGVDIDNFGMRKGSKSDSEKGEVTH